MCHCNPQIKSPFCGKPGCEWPAIGQSQTPTHAAHSQVHPLEWMPILGTPLVLPAKLLSDEWAKRNHSGQDLAMLASRGGVCLSEAAAIAMRRPFKPMLNDDALADLRRAAERAQQKTN